jgi:glutamyl-tRNA synthetase
MGYQLRTRIAPTPSGYLHLGNAWSFVLTWLAARSQKGYVHLRIDDLDAARFREEYLEEIFASLHWLGLDWDGGSRDAAEFKSTFSQRKRMHRYQEALDALSKRSSLGETPCVYACGCSREEVRRDAEAAGHPGTYARTCRDRNLPLESENFAWRYRTSKSSIRLREETGIRVELHPERDTGDFIVRQRNGDPSYQLTSGVDDEDLHINFVVRGMDLVPSTGAQLCLAQHLDWKSLLNARFWHHALVLDDKGEKISKSTLKSEARESLFVLRKKFPDPTPLYRFFARRMGIPPEGVVSVQDLLSGYRMEKVATLPLRLSDFWSEVGE